VIGLGAQQTDPAEIAAQVDSIREPMLDIDDDGGEQPLSELAQRLMALLYVRPQ
jgi:hypothetical protein